MAVNHCLFNVYASVNRVFPTVDVPPVLLELDYLEWTNIVPSKEFSLPSNELALVP